MPSLGLGLGLTHVPTLSKGGGVQATLARLRAQIAAYGGLPATLATSPTVTEGSVGGGAPTLTGESVANTDARLRYTGGDTALLGSSFPQNGFRITQNGTFSDATRNGRCTCVEFDTDASAFEVQVYRNTFATSQFRIYVNGQVSENNYWNTLTDGSRRQIKVDLTPLGGAGTRRAIKLEYIASGSVGTVTVANDGAIYAPAAPARMRLVVLGDSFVEGTGTLAAATSGLDYPMGWGYRLGRRLGASDIRLSGMGGTGWVADSTSPKQSLSDRIVADGVNAAADAYVIAMGLNDSTGIQATVTSTLAALRSARRNAPIWVVNRWNPSAPTPRSGSAATIAGEIASGCAGLSGVWVLDQDLVEYTKSDATHPNQAGHDTLGDWAAEMIYTQVGATVTW